MDNKLASILLDATSYLTNLSETLCNVCEDLGIAEQNCDGCEAKFAKQAAANINEYLKDG